MVRQRRGHKPTSSTDSSQVKMAEQRAPAPVSSRAQWIFLAVASGACAAFNGVFAKLTTTELTSSLSSSIASLFGLSAHKPIVEVLVRGMFFALNLTFNGIMWTLFTKALARGTSTTQVSIINTSTNFMLTAFLGLFIFAEALPPLWWAGASLLVIGNVIVGRKDESRAESEDIPRMEESLEGESVPLMKTGDEDVADLGDLSDEERMD